MTVALSASAQCRSSKMTMAGSSPMRSANRATTASGSVKPAGGAREHGGGERVGAAEGVGIGGSGEHGDAGREVGDELPQEPGLADAGLARHQRHRRKVGDGDAGGGHQAAQLRVGSRAADHDRAEPDAPSQHLVQATDDLHRGWRDWGSSRGRSGDVRHWPGGASAQGNDGGDRRPRGDRTEARRGGVELVEAPSPAVGPPGEAPARRPSPVIRLDLLRDLHRLHHREHPGPPSVGRNVGRGTACASEPSADIGRTTYPVCHLT